MVSLKEKGHNLTVSNIVVHKVNKIGGQKNTSLKLAEKELNIGKQEIYFVADVRTSFQRKSKPTYGIFEDYNPFNGFHQQLSQYIAAETSFLSFTQKSLEYYQNLINKSAPATGAFMVFADFVLKDNNERYILIFSINNDDGYNLSEELTIQRILNLDLSKLDVAALINISKWQQYSGGDQDGIRTYLSFIKGKKNLSDYFLDFIGCADKSTNEDSSKQLVTALNKYLEEKGMSREDSKYKKKMVFDYCQSCIKARKEVFLDQISFLLDEEHPDGFAQFASAEDYGVGDTIKPDSSILRSLHFIEYRSEDLTLVFSNSLISKKRISYNANNKTLTIKELPESLIKQIERNG
jgi:nucleoid-associated protein